MSLSPEAQTKKKQTNESFNFSLDAFGFASLSLVIFEVDSVPNSFDCGTEYFRISF